VRLLSGARWLIATSALWLTPACTASAATLSSPSVLFLSPALRRASWACVRTSSRCSTATAIRAIGTPFASPSATFRSSSETGMPAFTALCSAASIRAPADPAEAVESCAKRAAGAQIRAAERHSVVVRMVRAPCSGWSRTPLLRRAGSGTGHIAVVGVERLTQRRVGASHAHLGRAERDPRELGDLLVGMAQLVTEQDRFAQDRRERGERRADRLPQCVPLGEVLLVGGLLHVEQRDLRAAHVPGPVEHRVAEDPEQ